MGGTCTCVCMYLSILICEHENVHADMHITIRTYVCKYMCVDVYICVHMHAYLYMNGLCSFVFHPRMNAKYKYSRGRYDAC